MFLKLHIILHSIYTAITQRSNNLDLGYCNKCAKFTIVDLESIQRKVSLIERGVPEEILMQKYENRHLVTDEPRSLIENGYLIKTYNCGCVHRDGIYKFEYHNSYCNKHCPKSTYEVPDDKR